jgi:hypothetical protein
MELFYGTTRYDKTNRTVLRYGTTRQNEQNCPTVRHDTTKPPDTSALVNIDFSYAHDLDEQCHSSRNVNAQNIACIVQILTLSISSHNSGSLAVQMAYLLQLGFICAVWAYCSYFESDVFVYLCRSNPMHCHRTKQHVHLSPI